MIADRLLRALHDSRPTRGPYAAARALHRRVPVIRWGSLRRTEPVCPEWGLSRGTPIDRFYIERFVAEHGSVITGDVMEMADDGLVRRFGTSARAHVVDVDAGNPHATIVADLCVPGSLPAAAFDAVVLTQTLQYLRDLPAALANLAHAVRPSGTVLITVPALGPLDPDWLGELSLWRWTPNGLMQTLADGLPGWSCHVRGAGNVLACIGFLAGASVEDLTERELLHHDPRNPLIATAVARRPAAPEAAP